MTGERRISVLLVDADGPRRGDIGALLPAHCTLHETGDTGAALDLYVQHGIDCVLLDAGAAGGSLLDDLVDRGAAVVVLADTADEASGLRAMQRGAQDYFERRQLNSAALLRVIAYAAERSRLMREHLATLAALRDSERKFNDVVSRIDEALWLRDARSGDFIYLSPAFARICARPTEDIMRTGLYPYVHPDDQARYRATHRARALAGEEFHEELRVVRPDGEVRYIENRGFPVRARDGTLLRVGGIVRDITASLQQEQALRLAQKLEAIGQLAAGIAHEINTPSQYVSDNLAFVAESVAELAPLLDRFEAMASGAPARAEDLRRLASEADLAFIRAELPAALEQARHGIDQIKTIVLAMREFSHPGEDKARVDLNRAVRSTVTVARNEWKYVADLELELDDSLPPVPCVPTAINQVLLNLVINAAQAIEQDRAGGGSAAAPGQDGPTRGRIVVRTGHDDSHAIIEVSDDGCGIAPEVQARVFDPFFTTKEVGKGTGQGLALAYAIVCERHGGQIDLRSTPGVGTTFTVRLPLQAAPGGEL